MRPEFCRLFGSAGITKEIGLMLPSVGYPSVIGASRTTILAVVWIASIFFGIIDHLAVHDAVSSYDVTAIIADELISRL